jgi:hypothetical protein
VSDDRHTRPERETLQVILEFQRESCASKVEGLSEDDARRVMVPSGLSPLGVLRHLTWVEYGWFRYRFAGEDVPPSPRVGEDNAIQFALEETDTVANVVARYREACARSNEIAAAAASLDAIGARESGWGLSLSLRWIIVHMIEETARHAGHLDIFRELIDGSTGPR